MIVENPCDGRKPRETHLEADLVVVGGGLSGVCASITAARAGINVVLIQDRPVLGGNASSEVRLWILGATSHMGNNNRWAREGGVIDEILVENMYRNPEGNPALLDSILLEKVSEEPRIRLLLNASVHEILKRDDASIESVRAWCSQDSTSYLAGAPLFCDASGDGIAGFLAGAAFRMGAESREEFGEGFAPEMGSGGLLGHSLYFVSKDVGRPVKYVAPSFALRDITRIPRYRDIQAVHSGCNFWWFEYGGRCDTVHETEAIKWELWKVAYGAWDYIKNSGRFPEAETLTLEWIGAIPGKRESRRFEGDCILTQQDLVRQREHADAVSFGGWAIDLHPADGVFSELPGCTQWHSKGVYQIPYRAMYSRNISNLFITGRLISASHVAFGSTRVMATCAHNAQAVGMAAALCLRHGTAPRGVPVEELKKELARAGQFIPGYCLRDPEDLARQATVATSSYHEIASLAPNGETLPLDVSRAMLIPAPEGPAPEITFLADVAADTRLEVEVRAGNRAANYTPDLLLYSESIELRAGRARTVRVKPDCAIESPRYISYCLLQNPDVSVYLSDERLSGVLSLAQRMNKAVAKAARQDPPPDTGIDSFEFWLPARRPGGKSLAISVEPAIRAFCGRNAINGIDRPWLQPNCWTARPGDPSPRLTLRWPHPVRIAEVHLVFDTDFDHPMESVFMGHPEREMPFCVRRYQLRDACGALLYECPDNHQTLNRIRLPQPVETAELHLDVISTHGGPASLYAIRCYGA